jgi:hypothetical protein
MAPQVEIYVAICALAFVFMPLLPILTSNGVLPSLLTPLYPCILNQFCSNTLVSVSSSPSTHFLFPGTSLDIKKQFLSFTTMVCHDFRAHCMATHSRARMCGIVNESRPMVLICHTMYLFLHRRTNPTLNITPIRC